ncbi:AraC family transcriptional regulator [Alkalihalobacillus sp. TS-13]|uniref:AraC family transcriptional regulator n=1 Tax=Alkalihalobacillus sp. TS-13 TaxID=2842455 RepID=UPI001C886729|nr:AraC family transcriptional regulator [Alkalihalobacillus sp. TS-13]
MDRTTILHILNGQVMHDHFKKTRFLSHEMMVPFNEAMCYGVTSKYVFSDDFSEIRANVHKVTTAQYAEITLKPLQPFLSGDFSRIELWFDADMFCQINLLTILAWLDQTAYQETVYLHIVGEKFEPLEYYTLEVDGYHELYQQVLINKTMPDSLSLSPLQKGIELYLDYLAPDSDLMRYIQNHKDVPADELASSLLENFKDYGLGDTQYYELIKSSREHRAKEE